MESVLLVVHVIIGLVIVGLIMLQQGKGAEMGASFGAGSSQTVFGAAGSGNFFSHLTGALVAAFFVTSIVLAVMSKDRVDSFEAQLPVLEEVDTIPAESTRSVDEIPQAAPADVVEPGVLGPDAAPEDSVPAAQ